MQKFLRTLMLAVLFLPFALQAQNTLTIADGTTTNSNVPIHGLWADAYLRCQTIYTAGALDAAATGYGMTGGTISSVTYYMSTPASDAWTGTWEVKLMEVTNATLSGFIDMTNATTVYTGALDGTQSPLTITFTTPYTYQGGNLLIEVSETTNGNYKSCTFYGVSATGASWQGYNSSAWASITGSAQNFMPKTTFTFTGGTEITCSPVQNTAIDATQTTSSSLTLTWTDAINIGATYSVYDMNDNTLIESGITGTTYTVTGLDANTEYTFGVEANCSATDASSIMTASGRTECAAMNLPWTCSFEENEIVSTTQATALPWCSSRYSAPSTVSYPNYPYSYNSSTYAHTGSRSLYFYGTTGTSYPDTMAIILPEIDVNTYPMIGNRVTFWSRMSTASYSKNVYVGSMTDPSDITTLVVIDSVLVSGTTLSKYSVSLADAAGANIVLMVLKGSGNLYIDDVTIEELPSCLEVSYLTVSNTTANSMTLNWVDANLDAYFTIYDMADTSVVGTATDNTYTVENLTPNTNYTFGVQSNCTAGDAPIITVSGTTDCASETMPWSENFDNWTSKSVCWSFLSGAFNGGNGPASVYSSAWSLTSSSYGSITLSGKALTMNVYSTNKYWAVTPPVNITNDNAMLSVDVAVAAWSAAVPDYDTDDTLAFAISTDNGSTYIPLLVFDNTQINTLANNYTTLYIPVNGYNGQTVRFAIFAGSAASGGDNRIAIDNVSVSEPISCMPVLNLAANNITAESATLTWTSDATSFNVYVITQNDTTLVQNVTDASFDLTGLTAMTSYTYGVSAVCSDGESTIASVSFNTACTAATLPFTETFETTSGTLNCWTTDGPGTWSFGVGDYSTGTGAYEGAQNAKITHGVSGNATMLVSPVLDGVDNGLLLDFAYVMRAWSSDIDELRVYSRAAVDSAWQMMAEYTAEAATWTVESVVIPGTVYQVAFEYTDNYGYGLGIDSVVFTAMSDDYCFPVSNFAVDTATENTVSLSWNDENNSGATYTIYDMADNSVIADGINATNYEVTGLTSLTGYTFGIVANCSATDASNIVTVNAATACAGATCNITIAGEDSYGDGWNGNAINIMQAGVVIGTFTLDDGSTLTETFSICSEAPVSFSWTSGSYPGETSFEIFDGGNTSVYTGSGSNMTVGVFFTLNDACPSCLPATALTVDATTETSITISWTGTAASYDVYNGENFEANVTTTTYTFTGLAPASNYVFGIQAICSATDSSSISTVAASTECGIIDVFPYTQDFSNAPSCWLAIDADGDGNTWLLYQGTIQSASYASTALHPNNWLISPQFAIPATGNYEVTWTATAQDQSWPAEHYGVFISTTGNTDTSDFTMIQEWTLTTGVFNPVIDLSSYAGQNIYIALRHFNCTDQFRISIDDFIVREQAGANQVTINVTQNNPAYGTVAGGGIYNIGDNVTVSATAASGYSFSKWVDENNTTISTDNPYTFTAATNLTLQAVFLDAAGTTYIITVEVNDSIMGTATGGGTYTAGDQVTLNATANAGYHFVNWTQISSFGVNEVGTDPELVITVTSDKTFMANFEADTTAPVTQYTVTLNTADATMGTVSPAGANTVNEGSSFTATATANDGYHFVNWIDDNGNTFTTNPYTFIVNGNTTLTATFEANDPQVTYYNVTVNSADATMGNVSSTHSGQVAENTVVTVTATPANGYRFVAWMNGNTQVSTDNPYTFTVTEDITLTATFELVDGINDIDASNVLIYANNSTIYVRGAEGHDVFVYDMNGRCIYQRADVNETENISMSSAGIYLVRVDNAIFKKVVIVK